MKKSLLAAAFAMALPLGAMAQDILDGAPAPDADRTDNMERPPSEQTTCVQLGATSEFCYAANDEGTKVTSNGIDCTIIPGYVQDGMARYGDCAAFFDDLDDTPAHVECY